MRKVVQNVAVGFAVLSMLPMVVSAATTTQQGIKTSHPMTVAHTHYKKFKANGTPSYTSGFTPSQIKTAYGISSLTNQGAGETIAIVDAYGSPTISNDLNTFDAQFGLPAANLTIATPGGTPATDGGWAMETSLDVEWAHALAPQANILLVEAPSASIADLVTAEDYATNAGAAVVSNSWGGGEWSGESSYESHFTTPGVVYVASTGDNGSGTEWPSVSPNVLAVGGTSLYTDSYGNYSSESGWSGSGGGLSTYFSSPSYQSVVSGIVGSSRGVPDVSMVADPNTGVAIYDSTPDSTGSTGWTQIGGTSASAPMWASIIALADQGRSSNLSSSQAITQLYNLYGGTSYSSDFNDITSGSNGGFSAGTGYDLVTGIGSPWAPGLVPDLTAAP